MPSLEEQLDDALEMYQAAHENFLAASQERDAAFNRNDRYVAESDRMRVALEELVLYGRANPHVMAIIHRGLGMGLPDA